MKIKKNVAVLLQSAMEQEGISIVGLAGRIGIAKSSIQEYLHEKRDLRTDTLELISDRLDIPLEVIVSGKPYWNSTGSRAWLCALSDAIPSLHPLLRPAVKELIHVLEKIFDLSDSFYAFEQQIAETECEGQTYLYTPFKARDLSGFRVSYGLSAKQRHGDSWDTVTVTAPFSDDWAAVFDLAQQCSKMQIPPSQLPEVIDDFLMNRHSH